MHILCSFLLLTLVIIDFLNISWKGDFIGCDLFWLSVFYFAAGAIFSQSHRVTILIKFVINIVCFSLAFEKFCISINLIYQSATNSMYTKGNVTDEKIFIAQIILNSIQCFIFFAEIIISGVACFIYGREIQKKSFYNQKPIFGYLFFSIGTLFYGLIFCVCYIIFEIKKWNFLRFPLKQPFYPLANGFFALVVFIVQIYSFFYHQFITAALILQTIVFSLSLFVINSTATNLYYINSILQLSEINKITDSERIILVITFVLTAVAVFSCILNTICTIISLLGPKFYDESLDNIHEINTKLNNQFIFSISHLQHEKPKNKILKISEQTIPISELHIVKPIEEQTLYWSVKENPDIYKQTKQYFYENVPNLAYNSSYASSIKYFNNNNNTDTNKCLEKTPRADGNYIVSKPVYPIIQKKD